MVVLHGSARERKLCRACWGLPTDRFCHARRYETASCATFVRTVIPGSVALHKHALLLSVYFLTIAHLGLSNVGISLQLFVLNVHNTQYYHDMFDSTLNADRP